MVCAWYFDGSDVDQREPHKPENPQMVEMDLLKSLGLLHWKLNVDNLEEEGILAQIRKDRGLSHDEVRTLSKEEMPNYEERLKGFFTEHLHNKEETRFLLEGSGYIDVRDKTDQWIRIQVEQGDLTVLPAGIYHRTTLDTKNYLKMMVLSVGEPVFSRSCRPADDNPERKEYLQNLEKGTW